ncbi:MAG: FkbM family methyltransferase [Anaerolineae bacterium]|nr:FkbM family methyltransferase [Anaerolineae bacterium]
MDVWILKETWLDRFYERFGAPIREGWTVVDVGAGIGDFAIYAALRSPTSTVYAFEPFPESFRLLEENLRANQVSNVRAFPEALAACTGEALLDTSSGEPLQCGTAALSDPSRGLAVPALSLADALERIGGRCDLMKMDCEGAEYDILFSAPDSVFRRIAHLVMEVHDGPVVPHSRMDLAGFLRAKGFRVCLQANPVHAYLGFLYAERQ